MSASEASTLVRSAQTTFGSAIAVLLTSTALFGVLADYRWVMPAVASVLTVTAIAIVGRTFRWWPPLVVFVQFAALVTLLSTLFSSNTIFGVIPTPTSLGELVALLSRALDVLGNGLPPVPAELPLRCMVSLGLGVVAVLVDLIAVTAATPAVAGLVLLCVFAIPASLARTMLPWWTFAASAVGFAVLLISAKQRDGAVRTTGLGMSRQTIAIGGIAAVLALVVGTTSTAVGTEGRLPGAGSAGYGTGTNGVGLRPFTSLRGQLERDHAVELFRVRGLPRETYLRAMTLRKFDPRRGWALEGLTQGVAARGPLPLPEGTAPPKGQRARVEVEPLGYRDPWLPVFGMPTKVTGMGPEWRYDPAAGIVFTQARPESKPYVEELVLPRPSATELRQASGPSPIDPAYRDVSGIPPRVAELGKRITASSPTPFDKAVALKRYFTDPANGFRYDLRTALPTVPNPVDDFLFHGKRGYCEQFASSMAVLLRSVGVPSRVAVGFTSGYRDGDERVITTADAHAWVEAYFPGVGWTKFDPTPLTDGRTAAPAYAGDPAQRPLPRPTSPEHPAPPPPLSDPEPPSSGGAPPSGPHSPVWDIPGRWATAVGVSLLTLGILAAPLGLREIRRRRRIRTISRRLPGAAEKAWLEFLDQARDRGNEPAPSHTARQFAAKLLTTYSLDEEGVRAVHALVRAIEREWYGPADQSTDPTLPGSFARAISSLHENTPLTWTNRLLPRSVVFRNRGRDEKDTDAPAPAHASKWAESFRGQ